MPLIHERNEAQPGRYKLVMAAAAALAVALVPVVGLVLKEPSSPTQTLPDGVTVRLAGVTYGKRHGRNIKIDPQRNRWLTRGDKKPLSFRLDRYPPSTRRLNLTFAMHRSRTGEFLVKP